VQVHFGCDQISGGVVQQRAQAASAELQLGRQTPVLVAHVVRVEGPDPSGSIELRHAGRLQFEAEDGAAVLGSTSQLLEESSAVCWSKEITIPVRLGLLATAALLAPSAKLLLPTVHTPAEPHQTPTWSKKQSLNLRSRLAHSVSIRRRAADLVDREAGVGCL